MWTAEAERRWTAEHATAQRGLRVRSAVLVWLLIICFDVYFAYVNQQVRRLRAQGRVRERGLMGV